MEWWRPSGALSVGGRIQKIGGGHHSYNMPLYEGKEVVVPQPLRENKKHAVRHAYLLEASSR